MPRLHHSRIDLTTLQRFPRQPRKALNRHYIAGITAAGRDYYWHATKGWRSFRVPARESLSEE